MKRKVRMGRVLAIIAILAICALIVAAGSGWANSYWGHGKSYSYHQDYQYHNTYGGYSCGNKWDCGGCQTGIYIYYNNGSCGKCGGKCWPDINPPERPDCDDFCDDTPDDPCSDGSSSAMTWGNNFALGIPDIGAASPGLEKPTVP